ncbi:hypothetical protein A1Q1_02282 [Trichosporon asahii var. asahii CBS 2479]|uniref:F-box domain-containing protein n=1 Tax=Trichosporon asahii var. asahii (strain ATCC 90039 / CBS 2479 / JCM 2466 / KCTC 7840 / NBRC 103889/ NCYC 2677 / UAMH 7654) TaxID=1186058 RepID=J6F0P9_TRIAS|nr:hypothetical protein A1Q1_02282 [Trichosporon asahii var. asahii CBS 2479]EJT48737.1 hypothetical protein A1Q1_02282 [Trichosporon asahii var. asahii CBS 2479]
MGCIALFEGLMAVRARFSAQSDEFWGMREINLAANAIGDEGLVAAMFYCAKDMCMKELLLQRNQVTLEHVVVRVVEKLNASRLAKLSLASNPLNTAAVCTMFEMLDAPYLHALHLSACQITSDLVPALCAFLRSPRSQRLQLLELNGNMLGRAGVTAILDAIEEANFSLSRIGLFANTVRRWATDDNGQPAGGTGAAENGGVGAGGPEGAGRPDNSAPDAQRTAGDPNDHASMAWQIGERLPALQRRNGTLWRRVREAAVKSLAATRMILHAREPLDAETAQRVLASADPDAPSQAVFRLMDLPPELRLLIARHCSRDAYAMSDAQWSRVRSHAEKRETLLRMRNRVRGATEDATSYASKRSREVKVCRQWMEEVGCDRWELENGEFWDKWTKPAPMP